MSEKIQRHNGLEPDSEGAFVYYDDHVAWVIAELKALADGYCDCSQNGGHGGHDADCHTQHILERIAELKEEGK